MPRPPSHPTEAVKEPFPWRHILLATLIPAILGVVCAVFIAPPITNHDTIRGLMTWFNFVDGGTWNSISYPDPDNITKNIEVAVSWWAPGQYVPLGILHFLGLRVGTAEILLSALSILIFGVGVAVLAREMGIPKCSLAWLTFAACCSHHLLVEFGFFNGGEIAQMTVWPWAAFIAWKFRRNPLHFIAILPPILILGAFGKHSFAIYSLAILLFIFLERIRDCKRTAPLTDVLDEISKISYPILAVGTIFLIGRHFLIDTSHTPGSSGADYASFYTSFGYAFLGPILGLSGIDKSLGYISHRFFGVDGEAIWLNLGPILFIVSLISLSAYVWLSLRKSPADRFSGNTALIVGFIFSILLWRGGTISLDSRHYQPIVILLLISASARITNSNWCLRWTGRLILVWTALFGCATLVQRHVSMHYDHRLSYYKSGNIMGPLPVAVQDALYKVTEPDNTVLALRNWVEIYGLKLNCNPKTRFLPVLLEEENLRGEYPKLRYQGRVSHLVFAYNDKELDSSYADFLRASFVDYSLDEWQSYEVGEGWIIWQVGTVVQRGNKFSSHMQPQGEKTSFKK